LGARGRFWRSAASNAYYAIFLECRDALIRWESGNPRHNVHADVRLRFMRATDPDLKSIGDALDDLSRLRNRAYYDLRPAIEFRSPAEAIRAIRVATAALTMLDAIEADPARRAAVVASLPP
jgi:hypothetical protein